MIGWINLFMNNWCKYNCFRDLLWYFLSRFVQHFWLHVLRVYFRTTVEQIIFEWKICLLLLNFWMKSLCPEQEKHYEKHQEKLQIPFSSQVTFSNIMIVTMKEGHFHGLSNNNHGMHRVEFPFKNSLLFDLWPRWGGATERLPFRQVNSSHNSCNLDMVSVLEWPKEDQEHGKLEGQIVFVEYLLVLCLTVSTLRTLKPMNVVVGFKRTLRTCCHKINTKYNRSGWIWRECSNLGHGLFTLSEVIQSYFVFM